MEEIIIEGKKYVSSKQAAKMTGYAKDYIGQLCREGRVPARLVGRSWYVLEAAIQDHRFGSQESEQKQNKEVRTINLESVQHMPTETWEAPRYESAQAETLVPLNREEYREDGSEPIEEHKNIHDSWREWFDHIAEAAPAGSAEPLTVSEADKSVGESEIEESAGLEENENGTVAVPLHFVEQPFPKGLLPRAAPQPQMLQREVRGAKRRRSFVWLIQFAGALVAVAAVVLVALGSGYFDNYVVSSSRAQLMSGVSVYNR